MKTEEEIKELAEQRYGTDMNSYGGQRDGFKEGYKQCQQEQLNLHLVSKRELLNDMLMNQEEIISSPIRFNGVSIEKLKQIFEKNGVKYESPF